MAPRTPLASHGPYSTEGDPSARRRFSPNNFGNQLDAIKRQRKCGYNLLLTLTKFARNSALGE
jgi:hypothetical protein